MLLDSYNYSYFLREIFVNNFCYAYLTYCKDPCMDIRMPIQHQMVNIAMHVSKAYKGRFFCRSCSVILCVVPAGIMIVIILYILVYTTQRMVIFISWGFGFSHYSFVCSTHIQAPKFVNHRYSRTDILCYWCGSNGVRKINYAFFFAGHYFGKKRNSS